MRVEDGITASHITINNAKTGNGPALYDIAYEYETELRDYDKAYAWYRLSANKNCNLAQFKIGFLYNHGLGVPLDVILSMKYFLKAAGNSLRESNIQIGNHFVSGRGVNTNPRKALEWYYKANRYHERVKDFEDDGIYLTDDEKSKVS